MRRYYRLTLILSFTCCLLGTSTLSAQQVDFNKVVPGDESRPKTFEDYLVQLAWKNNPQGKILNSNLEIAKTEVSLTKNEWMNKLSAQFSLNEISLSNLIYNYDDPLFVAQPLWNLSATVDLGTLLNRSKEVRIAQERRKITEYNINLLKLELRALVIKRYYEYLSSIDILKARTEAEEEAYQNYELVGELFKTDKANFEDFSQASQSYINAKESKIKAETDLKLAKLLLEELIGVPYEEAERYGSTLKLKD